MIERELYFRDIDTRNQSKIETIKGVLEFAYIAIKSLILANGGAIVALLTLMGTIWRDPKDKEMVLTNIFPSLWWFCSGLTMAIVVSLFAYLAQFCYAYEYQSIGEKIRWGAVASAFLALAFFVIGAGRILCSFQ